MRPSIALDLNTGQEVAVVNYVEICNYDDDDCIIFIDTHAFLIPGIV
jgi:hypothetical protein